MFISRADFDIYQIFRENVVCSSEGQTSIFTKYLERMLCVHLKGRLRYLPDILRECCVFISRADFDIYQIFRENVVCSSQGQTSIFTRYSERMLCVHLKGRLRYLPNI